MSRVDVYMFPCYDCGDAEGQVSDTVSYLQSNNAKYTAFWLDIEGTQYWSTVKSNNQDFFNSLVSEAQKLGQTIGVYTSESQWNSIMGGSFTAGSKFPLWYPHYQIPADPSFDDVYALILMMIIQMSHRPKNKPAALVSTTPLLRYAFGLGNQN